MTTLRERAGRYLRDAIRGIDQAPVEVLATLCVAVTFSLTLEFGGETFRSWAELGVACVLILAVAWTGTLLHAMGVWNATRRWAVTVGGALVVALYALTVQNFEYEAEAWRAALLVAAAVLWVAALPAFAGPRDNAVARMRSVDGRILLRVIGAALYGIALFAGLALALRAIDVLFELDLRAEIYFHVWGWIAFVLVPWIVLGGLSYYVRPIEETTAVTSVANRIIVYLVPPLLALYFVILYAYVIRIGVTGEIPKNLVSPMVLAAGGLAALALVLFDPRPRTGQLARWLRLAPPLFLPLVPLGAWALLVRFDQYGWTEFRILRFVVLAALAVLALAATLQVVRRRAFTLHLVPLALAAIALLCAVGPWSVLAIAQRSQQSRLTTSLARLEIPAQDSTYARAVADTTARRTVPADDYEQLRSSAQYLARHFGADALPPVVRRLATAENRGWLDYAAALGLQPDAPVDDDMRLAMGGTLPSDVPLELDGATAYRVTTMASGRPGARVTGAGVAVAVPAERPSAEPAIPESVAAQRRAAAAPSAQRRGAGDVALQDSTRLALYIGEQVLYADLAPLIAAMRRRAPTEMHGDLPADEAVVPVTDSADVARGQLVVWNLFAESDSTGLRITNMEGIVVVRH